MGSKSGTRVGGPSAPGALSPIVIQRLRLGLSPQEVAREARVSYPHYKNIEKMKKVPSLPVGLRIAKVLRTTVEELFAHLLEA